jgi:hypothetical protein
MLCVLTLATFVKYRIHSSIHSSILRSEQGLTLIVCAGAM